MSVWAQLPPGSQMSVVHSLLSSQLFAVPPEQVPSVQVSPSVHPSPSSQGSPLATGVKVQVEVYG